MIVLDTGVLIDILRRHPPAGTFVRDLAVAPAASEATRVELLQGLRPHERRETERLMGALRWVPVDEAIARRAGELGRTWRPSHSGIDVPDLLVAATAQALDAPVATTNPRHFPMFKGLGQPY